jgi:RNA polymerase sigma factor (sigma-70 family)
VLTALKEVEQALATYSGELHRHESLSASQAAAVATLTLGQVRYRRGSLSFLDFIALERTAVETEAELAAALANDQVAVFKALHLETIRRFPILSREEESRLARLVREEGDRAAADTLITSHLRLVGKVAMRYRGYGLPMADVIEEGNVGLMQAVRRFDTGRDCRLATYALWWIKATIQEYVLRSWSLVKLGTTANQKKLFFGLRRTKSRIAAFEEGDLHPDHVAAIAIEVVEMNRRMNAQRPHRRRTRRGGMVGLAGR